MPTNYQDYFLSRISQPVTPSGGNAKFEALQQASRDKIAELGVLKDAQLKQEQLNAQSWAGKLGVEPDSATGEAVNLGASLYSGTFGVAGRLLSAPFSGVAAADQANLFQQFLVSHSPSTPLYSTYPLITVVVFLVFRQPPLDQTI